MKRMVANKIKKGTIESKVFVGVCTKRIPPIRPPTRLTGTKSFNQGMMLPIFFRYPMAPPNVAGRRAIVLVAFAGMDGEHTEISLQFAGPVAPSDLGYGG